MMESDSSVKSQKQPPLTVGIIVSKKFMEKDAEQLIPARQIVCPITRQN